MTFPHWLRTTNRILGMVSGIIILTISGLTTMEGMARGIFDSPTTWSLDVCQYLLIWAIFLGTSYAFQDKSHVSVDFIREGAGTRFGPGMQKGMAAAGYIFSLIYVAVLAWDSVDMFLFGLKWGKLTRGTIQIPIVWLYAAIFLGSVAMAVTIVFILASLAGKENDYL